MPNLLCSGERGACRETELAFLGDLQQKDPSTISVAGLPEKIFVLGEKRFTSEEIVFLYEPIDVPSTSCCIYRKEFLQVPALLPNYLDLQI